jgi:hypothetical protein
MSLIYLTQSMSLRCARTLCNTIEMTLGRVLGVDLGKHIDSDDHGEERSSKLR